MAFLKQNTLGILAYWLFSYKSEWPWIQNVRIQELSSVPGCNESVCFAWSACFDLQLLPSGKYLSILITNLHVSVRWDEEWETFYGVLTCGTNVNLNVYCIKFFLNEFYVPYENVIESKI